MNMKEVCVITNEECPNLIINYNKFIINYEKLQLMNLFYFGLVL